VSYSTYRRHLNNANQLTLSSSFSQFLAANSQTQLTPSQISATSQSPESTSTAAAAPPVFNPQQPGETRMDIDTDPSHVEDLTDLNDNGGSGSLDKVAKIYISRTYFFNSI